MFRKVYPVLLTAVLLCVATIPLRASQAPTATTLSLTVAGAPVTNVPAKTVVTLAATVSSAGTNLTTGQVNFCEASAKYCTDVHIVGTVQLTGAGTASYKFIPGVGTHSYKAVFVGTNAYQASASAAQTLTVTSTGIASTTNTLVATGQAGDYILTATVTGAPYTVPTGSIPFVDTSNSNYLFGTGPLSVGARGLNFIPTPESISGIYPESTVGADFNGDGTPDLAIASGLAPAVTLWLGKGDGTFTLGSAVPANLPNNPIVTADFNGDGCADLAFINVDNNSGNAELQAALGHCDGTFTLAPFLVLQDGNVTAITAADFNHDGKVDLALAAVSGAVTVFLGNGDGTFVNTSTSQTGAELLTIVSADFNGDGHMDMATASIDTTISVLYGNGDGTFQPSVNITVAPNLTGGLAVADFNGDGIPDLAVCQVAPSGVIVLLGNGTGFNALPSVATGPQPIAIGTADFNADGIPDLVTGNYGDNTGTVLIGVGDGTFTPIPSIVEAGDASTTITVADFNDDGVPDLAFGDHGGEGASILLAASTSSATITGVSPVGSGIHYAQASYPGDSANAASASNLVPLDAEQVPTELTLSAAPSGGSTVGQQVTLTAALDKFYAQGHYASGNVAFSSNGQSLGTAAVQNNGMATLTTTALPAGTDNLKAVYPGDINFLGSTAAIVPYPVVAQTTAPTITFTVPNHTYGDPPFAVMATSNSPGAITYSVVSGPATIAGSTVTLTGAGTVVLEASQAASGTYSAGSAEASFAVGKEAQTITFPQPISPVPQSSGSIALVATASSGLPVAFSVVSGPGTVSGNQLTFTAAGTVVVAANQAGNANYSPAPQVTRTIVVLAPAVAVNLTAAPNPVFVQNPVTLQATLAAGNATPTGTVTFEDGGTPLGTVAVSNNTASLTVSTLTIGFHSLSATYNGNAQFAPSTSPVDIELVEDFSLSSNNPNVTISHGGTATYTLLVGPVGAAVTAQPVALSVSGAPEGSVISLSPQALPPSMTTTPVTLTIRPPNYPVGPWSMLHAQPGSVPAVQTANLALLTLGAGLLFSMRKRRMLLHRLVCIVVLFASGIALLGLAGCGSGWKTQHYTLSVTAVSGNLTHTTTLSLTTQCADGKTACPIVQ